mmetsp:Transcript_9511/g.27977  ORF Transcript_9511/g.27977 Transcript_9511/m.27977 type:complete len:210 (+) Transcript_9511:520-1149(+)
MRPPTRRGRCGRSASPATARRSRRAVAWCARGGAARLSRRWCSSSLRDTARGRCCRCAARSRGWASAAPLSCTRTLTFSSNRTPPLRGTRSPRSAPSSSLCWGSPSSSRPSPPSPSRWGRAPSRRWSSSPAGCGSALCRSPPSPWSPSSSRSASRSTTVHTWRTPFGRRRARPDSEPLGPSRPAAPQSRWVACRRRSPSPCSPSRGPPS